MPPIFLPKVGSFPGSARTPHLSEPSLPVPALTLPPYQAHADARRALPMAASGSFGFTRVFRRAEAMRRPSVFPRPPPPERKKSPSSFRSKGFCFFNGPGCDHGDAFEVSGIQFSLIPCFADHKTLCMTAHKRHALPFPYKGVNKDRAGQGMHGRFIERRQLPFAKRLDQGFSSHVARSSRKPVSFRMAMTIDPSFRISDQVFRNASNRQGRPEGQVPIAHALRP